jgi:hypothetical protein
MALGDLHLSAVTAPQTNVLPQDERLDQIEILDSGVVVFKLQHELDSSSSFFGKDEQGGRLFESYPCRNGNAYRILT